MKPIDSKLPNVGTTIFTTMGQMAHRYGAINLSQGFPNFEVDKTLLDLVDKAMKGGYNQYAPMQGIYSLRACIAEKIEQLYGASYHPEAEITITTGATQGIFTVISTFIKAGDEVIVFKPAYDCYEPAVTLYGGVVVPIQLEGSDHQINWEEVRQAITPKTKMVIINTPHNPTGSILTETDLLKLQALLRDTAILVLSDEVYEHIVFDGSPHESVSKYPDLRSRSIVCASFGKTFHATGWKIGYCAAPQPLMHEFQKVHQYTVFCVNHPIQKALAAYLKHPEHYLQLNSFYQKKRDYFLKAIKGSAFTLVPSKGTYFQLLSYDKITDESDIEFAQRLVKEYGVASIPISVFNANSVDKQQLRFCFAKTNDTLDQAAERLWRVH